MQRRWPFRVGVTTFVVGLAVVAFGFSAPEAATSMVSGDNPQIIVVSNIVGSIIFNCFFVLGVGALVTKVPIAHYTMVFHIPVMILFAALMFIMVRSRNRITKKDSVLLVSVYLAYIALMVIFPERMSGIVLPAHNQRLAISNQQGSRLKYYNVGRMLKDTA